jgi:CheY-like chemotaxis protein
MTDSVESPNKKVLIADDDPSIVNFLADRCKKLGFEVEKASNGLRALALARRTAPDVLIVDLHMPALDGLSLCARLLSPGEKPIEVVLITGNSHPQTIERCEALGASYAHKGPNFWIIVQSALAEIFPEIATRIANLNVETNEVDIHGRPRILVVDDDPDVGKFLCSRLQKCGVDPLFAPDGVAGFRLARTEQPTVILSDYYMPNGDALYLLWKLRSTATTENIPVFIMSGRRLDEASEANLRREFCGRPGAVQFFTKPLSFDEIVTAIQRVCGLQNCY